MPEIAIAPLRAAPETIAQLRDLIVEAVASGGSLGFMHPLSPEDAETFWRGSLEAAERGGRVVLGSWDGEAVIGTVSLLLDLPPNQPHRAEIAKLMVRPSHRGRGIASALMRAAEAEAEARGRTLMVLDTAAEGGAAGLYEGLGFTYAGEIPDYALKPYGGLTATRLYWKRL